MPDHITLAGEALRQFCEAEITRLDAIRRKPNLSLRDHYECSAEINAYNEVMRQFGLLDSPQQPDLQAENERLRSAIEAHRDRLDNAALGRDVPLSRDDVDNELYAALHQPEQPRSPEELYPDLDLDTIRKRAKELAECESDEEAIRMVMGDPKLVGITGPLHQPEQVGEADCGCPRAAQGEHLSDCEHTDILSPPDPQDDEEGQMSTTAAYIYRVEIDGLVNPSAIHFGPEVGDLDRVAENWRKTGAHVTRFVPAPEKRTECDECDDGFYYEGDEWTPCTECERGRTILGHLKTAVAEAREEAAPEQRTYTLEEIRERLLGRDGFRAVLDAWPAAFVPNKVRLDEFDGLDDPRLRDACKEAEDLNAEVADEILRAALAAAFDQEER